MSPEGIYLPAAPRRIVLPKDPAHEFVRIMTHATVEKRTADYDLWLDRLLSRRRRTSSARR